MKKAVFAIQVFGLIAILPIYVVAELNHGTKGLTYNNSITVAPGKPVKENNQSIINSTVENKNKVFVIGLKNCH